MTHITLTFLARRGGVPRIQAWLANALAERGLQISIVVPDATGVDLQHVGPGIEVVSLATSSRGRFVTRFARYLRQEKPDAVLACQHHTGLLTLLAAQLARYRGKQVITLHNHISAVSRQQFSGRFLFPAMRLLYRKADGIVCVSRGVGNDLEAHVPHCSDRLRVVFNPLPIDLIAREALEPCGEPWLDNKDAPTYVAVGRLVPQKDYDTLLQAHALVRRQRPTRLVFVGDGASRSILERQIDSLDLRDCTRVVGYRENPYPFMSRADALVVSSRWEGFCLVIAEALSLGVQVVSTDCDSGPAEILDGGRYGRLVPVGEPSALAGAMLAVLRREDRIDPSLLKSRADIFRPEYVAQQYLQILEERGGAAAEPRTSPAHR